jgi:hypothetical protein
MIAVGGAGSSGLPALASGAPLGLCDSLAHGSNIFRNGHSHPKPPRTRSYTKECLISFVLLRALRGSRLYMIAVGGAGSSGLPALAVQRGARPPLLAGARHQYFRKWTSAP